MNSILAILLPYLGILIKNLDEGIGVILSSSWLCNVLLCGNVVSFSCSNKVLAIGTQIVSMKTVEVGLHIARVKIFALLLVVTVFAQILSQELINSPNSISAKMAKRKAETAELLRKTEAARLDQLARLEADKALRRRIDAMEFYEAPAAVAFNSDVQQASMRFKVYSPKDEVLVRNDDALVTGSLKSGSSKETALSVQPAYAVASLQSVIQKHASAEGVPLPLAYAIVRSESGFNPNVTNAGALGLMQIKLQAAQAVGYQGNADGLLDADTNLRFGMRFLGRVYQMAKGDACRTIAIYRSGNPASAGDQGYCARAFRDEDTKEPAGKSGPAASPASPG